MTFYLSRLDSPVFLARFLLCGMLLLVSLHSTTIACERPNIVLILADDLGYGSLNCYGADENHIRTPNIDPLAGEGRRFTDANTPSSVCSPTRYGLLTGRYDWRTDQKHGVLNTNDPLHIEPSRATIASLLKSVGYQTAAIGKWHLGYGKEKADFTKLLTPGPLDLGFDYHFAVPQNHGDATGVYVRNQRVVGLRSVRTVPAGKSAYGRDDDLYLAAIQFIHENKDGPFYVNVWGHATHFPVNTHDDLVKEFKDITEDRKDFAPKMQHKFDECLQIGGDLNQSMRQYLGDVYQIDLNPGFPNICC